MPLFVYYHFPVATNSRSQLDSRRDLAALANPTSSLPDPYGSLPLNPTSLLLLTALERRASSSPPTKISKKTPGERV